MSIRRRFKNKGGILVLLFAVLGIIVLLAVARGLDGAASGGGGGGGSSAPANIKFKVSNTEYTIKNGSVWDEVVSRYEDFTVDETGKVLFFDEYLVDDRDGFAVEVTHKVKADMEYLPCDHRHLEDGAVYTSLDNATHSADGTCTVCGYWGAITAKHSFIGEFCQYCNRECMHDLGDPDYTCAFCHVPTVFIFLPDRQMVIPKTYTWRDVANKYRDFNLSAFLLYKKEVLVDFDGNIIAPDDKPVNQAFYEYCSHKKGKVVPIKDQYTTMTHMVNVVCTACGHVGQEAMPHIFDGGSCKDCDYVCYHLNVSGEGSCPDCGAYVVTVSVVGDSYVVTSGVTWGMMAERYNKLSFDVSGRLVCNGKIVVNEEGISLRPEDEVKAGVDYVACYHAYMNGATETYVYKNSLVHTVTGECLNGCGTQTATEAHTYKGELCLYCATNCKHDSGKDENNHCLGCGTEILCEQHDYNSSTGVCNNCGECLHLSVAQNLSGEHTCSHCGDLCFVICVDDQYFAVESGETWGSFFARYGSPFAIDKDGYITYNGYIVLIGGSSWARSETVIDSSKKLSLRT